MAKVTAVECTELSLDEARQLPPLPSFYRTRQVYRLYRDTRRDISWRLAAEALARPFEKTYDNGVLDEWLESYDEATRPELLQFAAAYLQGTYVGLLTWQPVQWNNTAWLVDIRVAADARRSGVGSALLDHLRSSTRTGGLRGITVETQINNYPAIQFYIAHGFVIEGFRENLYTNHDMEEQDVALFLFWPAR